MPVKKHGQIVAVVSSPSDLARALRLRSVPDLLELRLDSLFPLLDRLEAAIPRLHAPLIVTARDPREGGANELSLPARREILARFLPYATYLDVELASVRPFGSVLRNPSARRVRRIFSFHDFAKTPAPAVLSRKADLAVTLGADVFKLATRVETTIELDWLLAFFDDNRAKLPIAAMGVGALGSQSRIELARRGSVLNYAHLGDPQAAGQLSILQLRATLRPRAR